MLQERINNAIRESLPQQVGAELKTELERLYGIEENSKELKKTIKEYREDTDSQGDLINMLQADLAQHFSIDKKREELRKAEFNYELMIANERIERMQAEADRNERFVSMLLRNPVLKHRTTNETRHPLSHPFTDNHGVTQYSYGGESITHDEVIEEKEIT